MNVKIIGAGSIGNHLANACVAQGLSVTIVDIDKDADADLFLGVLDGTVGYFENVGTTINPVFSQKTGSSNPLNNVVVSGAAAPAFADFDSDGDMDVFIGQEDGTISYFKS